MSNKKDDLLTFADWIAYHRKVETDPKWVLARLEKILRETAVEQSVQLTVLPVREIETVCPHCSLVFDVPVPEPHSK